MYTIKDILELEPCKEYTKEKLEELWKGKKTLSRRDILKLNIPIDDRNWVIPQLVSTDTVVEWAQYCADTAKKHAANAVMSAASSNAAHYAANARFAANARAAATNARCVTRYAAANAGSTANAGYAKYAAADARAAAANARCVTRYAAANAGSAALSAWSGNRDAELYRLLTVLCDMEERCTQ